MQQPQGPPPPISAPLDARPWAPWTPGHSLPALPAHTHARQPHWTTQYQYHHLLSAYLGQVCSSYTPRPISHRAVPCRACMYSTCLGTQVDSTVPGPNTGHLGLDFPPSRPRDTFSQQRNNRRNTTHSRRPLSPIALLCLGAVTRCSAVTQPRKFYHYRRLQRLCLWPGLCPSRFTRNNILSWLALQ